MALRYPPSEGLALGFICSGGTALLRELAQGCVLLSPLQTQPWLLLLDELSVLAGAQGSSKEL